MNIWLVVFGVLFAGSLTFWLVSERGVLMRPSTLEVLKLRGPKGLFNYKTYMSYLYGRWTKQYINILTNFLIPRLGPRGRKWWRDRYHGKVLTTDLAQALLTIEEDIPRTDLEQIIPYPMARELILNGPPEVAAYECACRANTDNDCGPSQVCLTLGQPFVDFMLEHHPDKTHRLTTLEALELVQDQHQRGNVHAAWFSEFVMGRMYALCNCCKCCCGGIQTMLNYDSPVVTSSGFVSQVDELLCSACGDCEDACAFEAITVEDYAIVDWDNCMGCGVCEGQCTISAITLVRDEAKGIPLDVRLLARGG